MKKLRLKKEVIIIGVILLLIIIGLFLIPNKKETKSLTGLEKFTLNNKKITLKRGEELSVNGWNDLEVIYNNKIYNDTPTIYNDITLGTNYEKVLESFGIEKGYAITNREVPTKEKDGTTDIIEEEFKNKNIFKKKYLDLYLVFGYKKVNKKWTLVSAKELEKLMDTDNELLIFYIDFNGMEDEIVDKGEVIAFTVTYQ